MAPLMFLAVSAVLNTILDLCFVLGLKWGVAGAAAATVFSQYVAGIGIFLYSGIKLPYFHEIKKYIRPKKEMMKAIGQFSFLTCLQQSVMNLGILMVQGLVNSFGTVIMAAFAAAVKITLFCLYAGAGFWKCVFYFCSSELWSRGREDRIKNGIKKAVRLSVGFSLCISAVVFIFARPLMMIFIRPEETAILNAGVESVTR